MYFWLWLSVALVLLLVPLGITVYCFFKVFYVPGRDPEDPDAYEIPDGEIYEPYREGIVAWTKMIREMPREDVEITSFDGLTLRGRYYEYAPGAPVELLFHGYRGNAERDLSGGVARCFSLGRSAILIDHRAGGRSDGHVTTFGIRERRDCLAWVQYALQRFGPEVKLILTGVSMGAATVMMAMSEPLPPNVVCVLADCGYSSPREIICKVMRDMHLPAEVFYPFVRLAARLFGRFDLEETSPLEAVRKTDIPLILIHGDVDAFVPYEMSVRVFEACRSQKKLVPIRGAGHGLAYPTDPEGYVQALTDFQQECGF